MTSIAGTNFGINGRIKVLYVPVFERKKTHGLHYCSMRLYAVSRSCLGTVQKQTSQDAQVIFEQFLRFRIW